MKINADFFQLTSKNSHGSFKLLGKKEKKKKKTSVSHSKEHNTHYNEKKEKSSQNAPGKIKCTDTELISVHNLEFI